MSLLFSCPSESASGHAAGGSWNPGWRGPVFPGSASQSVRTSGLYHPTLSLSNSLFLFFSDSKDPCIELPFDFQGENTKTEF